MIKDYSRGAKHGPSEEQYDHFEARDSTRNAQKKEYSSITDRWHGEDLLRNSANILIRSCQLISHTEVQEQSVKRYENNLTLGVNG